MQKNIKITDKWIKWLWVALLVPMALLALMLTLTATGLFGRMPSFVELENPKSNLSTEVYSEDGKVIGSFFLQNRSYVQYAELFSTDSTMHLNLGDNVVSPLEAALVATEDIRYREHSGIDLPSLARVAVKTVLMQNISQGGGSTITQQVAKNLFPRDTARNDGRIKRGSKLIVSKFKEWITALKLEYNYTKEEIVAMYLNTVGYGANAYGIKSAAQTFFNKEPNELNIQEAALLVGVVNAPTRYSPVINPDNALNRRNLVLARMATAGAISDIQRDSLSSLPIVLNYQPISHNMGSATYFREMLRLTMNAQPPKRNNYYTEWDYEEALRLYNENPIYGWCHKNKKADGTPYNIYRDGLKIYTTINSVMQEFAERSVQKQLEESVQPKMDAQYRRTRQLFIKTPKKEQERIIRQAMRYSDRYYQMNRVGISEKEIYASFERPTQMKVFTFKGERDTLLTPRDSILHHKRIMRASLVAIAPRTGEVKAYVGGPSFKYFKYDMAKQGKRQVGSTIKPFIYTFAIDHLGMSPCTEVPNLPVTIETANGTPWSPKESGKVEYDGVMHPLMWGLARSRNNYSAWIMKQAKQPAAVADFIHNMGFKSYIDPVPSLCLGPAESNVFEMASAFSTFANEGVYTEPIFVTRIEDRQGNVIANFIPKSQDAISERTAYTMLMMLRNVVQSGTAGRLNWMYNMRDVEIGGKTGTSNESRDAWFMSVAPNLVVGTWVGAEDQAVHLLSQAEGSTLALPIVGEFMRNIYDYEGGDLGVSKYDRFITPTILPEWDCDDEAEEQPQEREIGWDDTFFE